MINELYKQFREELDPNQIQFEEPNEKFAELVNHFINRSDLYSSVLNNWPHLNIHERMEYAASIKSYIRTRYLISMSSAQYNYFEDELNDWLSMDEHDMKKAVYDAIKILAREI